jgi:hypothetical protein
VNLRIERRGKIKSIICACCDLPFAQIQFGRLVVVSKHYTDRHTNGLTVGDLEEIISAIKGQKDDIIAHVPDRAA